MDKTLGIALVAFAFLAARTIRADTIFNLRANLEYRDYVAGTITVNTATGLVRGENVSVFNDSGGTIATFNNIVGQGPAIAYDNNVFGSRTFNQPYDSIESIGPANTGFMFNTPATSLIDYAGGEICAVSATAACYPSFFAAGLPYGPSAVPAH